MTSKKRPISVQRARRTGTKSRTVGSRQNTLKLLKKHSELSEFASRRPRTRGDCESVQRPCQYLSCKYNMYLDVTSTGGIKFNYPDVEPEEMVDSCLLDLADEGPLTLDQTAQLMNLTKERVRQIEKSALVTLKHRAREVGLPGYEGE